MGRNVCSYRGGASRRRGRPRPGRCDGSAFRSASGKRDFVVFGGFADILPTGCTLLAESAVAVEDLNRDELTIRIDAARDELRDALHHEHKSRLEHFIMEMSHLQGMLHEQ